MGFNNLRTPFRDRTADSERVQKELSDLRGQLQELIELRNRVEQLENASVANREVKELE